VAPVVVEKQQLRQLIGGRYAVSWQGYLVMWPFSVLFIMTTTQAFAPPGRWLAGVLVSTAAYAAVGAILWLASITVLRNRREHAAPIALVAIVGGLAWMARSAVLKFYLESQGLPSLAPLHERLIFGFLLGMVAVPITAWMVASFADFSEGRRQLVGELVREEIKTQQLATYVEAMRQGIVDRVQQRVTATTEAVRWPDSDDASASARGIQALDSLSREAARELSANLWQQAQRSAKVTPWLVIRSGAMTKPFTYWPLVSMFAFSIPIVARTLPLSYTMALIVPTAVYVLLVAFVANRLAPRLSPNAAVASYVIAIGFLLASGLVVQFADTAVGSGETAGQGIALLASLGFGLFYPLGGPLTRIGILRAETLDRLRTTISQQEITNGVLRREEQRIRREIATALHGSWTANLTAASMRLQQAIDGGDREAATQALFEARQIVDVDIASVANQPTTDLPSILDTLIASWEGLVTITANIDQPPAASQRVLKLIEDVVTEGINNAVRHGDADRIDITIAEQQSSIQISISDNGTAGPPSGRRGTGTRLLDALAPN